MSNSSIDSSFQFKLSNFLSKSLNGEMNDSAKELSYFVQNCSGQPQTGGLTPPIVERPGASTTAPSSTALADSITIQQTANRRLRLAALTPLMEYLQSFDMNNDLYRRPTLAELARCQRFKRVLDVHTDTMKIEQEINQVWSADTTIINDQLQQFGRRRAIDRIEQATQTLTEHSQMYTLHKHEIGHSSPTDSAIVAPSTADGRRLEQTIYYCHEAVEKTLRALIDLGVTLQVVGREDNLIMMQFDEIGKRRTGSVSSTSASPTSINPPTLVNYKTAITSLLNALPPKYNIDVLKAIATELV